MNSRNLGTASITLFVSAAALLTCSLYYAYQTGCTADLKTGSLGDPQEALRLSSISFLCFLSGLASGSLGIFLLRKIDLAIRAGFAMAFFVLGGIALWIIAIYLEAHGVQHCLSAV